MNANLIYNTDNIEDALTVRLLVYYHPEITEAATCDIRTFRKHSIDYMREVFRTSDFTMTVSPDNRILKDIRFTTKDCKSGFIELQGSEILAYDSTTGTRYYRAQQGEHTRPLQVFRFMNEEGYKSIPASIRAVECVTRFNDMTYPIIDNRYHQAYDLLKSYLLRTRSSSWWKADFLFEITDISELNNKLSSEINAYIMMGSRDTVDKYIEGQKPSEE